MKINKIESYKNDILNVFYDLKTGEKNIKTETSASGAPISEDVREKYLNHISHNEYNECKEELINDKFLISEITEYSYSLYISLKGKLFIKSGGYCFKNKLKNFLGKGSLVIIGALISGFFTILGIILGYWISS